MHRTAVATSFFASTLPLLTLVAGTTNAFAQPPADGVFAGHANLVGGNKIQFCSTGMSVRVIVEKGHVMNADRHCAPGAVIRPDGTFAAQCNYPNFVRTASGTFSADGTKLNIQSHVQFPTVTCDYNTSYTRE